MRYAQWMVQDLGVDGFRFDAAKNIDPWVLTYFDRAVYRSSFRTRLARIIHHAVRLAMGVLGGIGTRGVWD
jgi:glycosidase